MAIEEPTLIITFADIRGEVVWAYTTCQNRDIFHL